ncbi:MAG TPA: phosphatidate cytidylyltransferase [Candidatus Hydrogenedentes bacterium]|nr:phosphatidate cytidylyltransferase [Candidatus Hydrogenedentota bacterium]HOS01853.1 phosphatidate cytidylyltransferase [Candidatus Hydrogenedentota bacterium]
MGLRAVPFAIRLATTVIVLPAVLWLTCAPAAYCRIGFAAFVGALSAIGLYEYYAIVRCRRISPETIGGILAGTLIVLCGYFHNAWLAGFLLYGGCLLVSALHIVRGQHSVAGLASSLFGVFYVGWLGAHITLLHSTPKLGPGLIVMLFTSVVLTDSAAYLAGSTIGRHKFAPKVSPNKTWEGSVAGLLAAVGGMLLLHQLKGYIPALALPAWSASEYGGTALLLSIASQLGDLTESCLKRDAGVKDSGMMFPGHGGVLDRCDGFLFAAPMLYYVVMPLNMQ